MPTITITVDDRELKRLINESGDTVQYVVADGVEYGVFVELGTTKMAARPAARPAVEAVRPGWEAAFRNQLTDAQVSAVVRKNAFEIEGGWKGKAAVDTGAYKNSIHVIEGDSPDTFTVTFESERGT